MLNLSIVICTLNEEFYLPKLLDSIKSQQTHSNDNTDIVNYEIIIVDAGSEDGTSNVIKQYQKVLPITFIPLVNNRNISMQRNTGADNAQYELLLFLDADVVLPPAFLITAIPYINKKNIKVAGTLIYAAENEARYRFMYWSYSHLYMPLVRMYKPIIHGCSIFSTKEIHNKIGGFNQGMIFEDYRYGVDSSKYYRPRLLKNIHAKTSARRFYNSSPRASLELMLAGVYSFFKTGISSKKYMKEYHANTGRHSKPRY